MTISGFIAYVKQAWHNRPNTSTPISAERLTHIEDGIKGNSDAIANIAAAVVSQIVNDPNKIASMAALFAVNQQVTQLNSDLASKRTTVPNRLDNGVTTVDFYKSNGTVSVQISFQLIWRIDRDAEDLICTIPNDFVPAVVRWINSTTSNTGKNIQYDLWLNENKVWCLYLTALENLAAGDRINDSFLYQI